MYPSTEKIANPEKKLVMQFTVLVKRASLQKEDTQEKKQNKKLEAKLAVFFNAFIFHL